LSLARTGVFASNPQVPEWIEVFILALIEGVTEFLPISSTGHMLLAQHWLKHPQGELFLAVVQSGAVLAVLMVFTERLRQLLTRWREKETQQFIAKLAAAFAVTAAGGLVLKKLDFVLPKDPVPVALATLIGGILILFVEWSLKGRSLKDTVSWPIALAIGAGQLLAILFPGLSRSGSTIILALALGIARRPATEFAFLLGIPTLLSAGALEILKAVKHPEAAQVDWAMVLWGTFVAAVTAFAAVRWLLKFIQTHTFVGFGWYRIALGAIILLLVR
jgi:undecaprenyl-diphosphatase